MGDESLPVCRDLNIAFVAYSPLGRALLTGAIKALDELPENDRRRQHPRFSEQNIGTNLGLVQRVREIAAEKRIKPAQLVLAWLLAQDDRIVALPGTKHVSFLEENVAAIGVRLSEDELRAIDAALPVGAAAGLRYPDKQMRNVQI